MLRQPLFQIFGIVAGQGDVLGRKGNVSRQTADLDLIFPEREKIIGFLSVFDGAGEVHAHLGDIEIQNFRVVYGEQSRADNV